MTALTLRNVKGTPLTNAEIDDNFSNLNTEKLEHCATLVALKALDPTETVGAISVIGRTAAGDGYGGIFDWISGDQSANVTADPQNGIWVAPSSDLTGASGAWKRRYDDAVNVKWFGAVGDGVTDDTAAIQAVLDAVKGADNTAEGKLFSDIYFPFNKGGFYRVSDSLVIDGTYGITLRGPGGYTKRGDEELIRWYGDSTKPVFHLLGRASGVVSNPNFDVKFENITINGYQSNTLQAQPATIPSGVALGGIYMGPLPGATLATLQRNVTIRNCQINNCQYGVYSGNPGGQNTDHAMISLENVYIKYCAIAGYEHGTGNAVGLAKNLFINGSGWVNDLSDARGVGAHVLLSAGSLDLYNYVSGGATVTKTADIFQQYGRLSVFNTWQEVKGYAILQGSAPQNRGSYMIGQITGVNHYSGSFTRGEVSKSMRIRAPGTVVTACRVFGDIEVDSGLGTRPVFIGINFIDPDAGFVGSGVETQRSLINIGSKGNFSQIQMGGTNSGVPFEKKGDSKDPHLLFAGDSPCLLELIPASASGTGMAWYTRTDDANGFHQLYFNAYYDADAGGFVPYQNTRLCFKLDLGGPNGFRVHIADPKGSSGVLSFVDAGGLHTGHLSGYREEVAYMFPKRAADPYFTSADWWEGSVYYNTTTNKLRVNTGGATWVDLH